VNRRQLLVNAIGAAVVVNAPALARAREPARESECPGCAIPTSDPRAHWGSCSNCNPVRYSWSDYVERYGCPGCDADSRDPADHTCPPVGPLSEASLEEMLIEIRRATDDQGTRIRLRPTRILR